jgi:hypothetical protein
LVEQVITKLKTLPATEQDAIASVILKELELAENLNAIEDIAPLESFKTYDLPTPYNSFGAGAILMAALQQKDGNHLESDVF